MARSRGVIHVATERCKGCGLCISVCPVNIIEIDTVQMNSAGHQPAHVPEMEHCIGCADCAQICPDCAITVERFRTERRQP